MSKPSSAGGVWGLSKTFATQCGASSSHQHSGGLRLEGGRWGVRGLQEGSGAAEH